MHVVKRLTTVALAVVFAASVLCMQMPQSALASVKRGTMQIDMDSAVEMNVGTSAAVNCAVTPMSERQRPCCSTDYCPSGCEAGGVKGCLDPEGFCTCLGGDYFTANAKCSVTSSAPSIARAKWSAGVLSVKGYAPGTATITVTAKMTLWIAKSQTLSVTIHPKPSADDEPSEPANGQEEAHGSDDTGSDNASTASDGKGSSASTGGGSSKKTSAGSGSKKSSKSSKTSKGKSSKASSNSKKSSSTSSSSSSSKKSGVSVRSTSGSGGVSASTPAAASNSVRSATVSAKTESADEPDDEPDDEPAQEDAEEPTDELEQAQAEPLDASKAASAVSYTGTDSSQPAAPVLVWAAAFAALALIAAGAFARWRVWKKQHAVLAVADDDDDNGESEDKGALS